MANTDSKQMIVGLDIGTSKVVAVVGEVCLLYTSDAADE